MNPEPSPKAAIDHRSLEWMPKEIWGPIKWKELHARAQAPLPMAGEEEWFEEYIRGLPCKHCRHHFEEFVRQQPPHWSSRVAFFEWTVQAHNHVNAALGKAHRSLKEGRELNPFPTQAESS